MRKQRRETFEPVAPAPDRRRHRVLGVRSSRRLRWVALPSVGVGALAVALVAAAMLGGSGSGGQPYAGKPVVAIVGGASARSLVTGSGDTADAIGTGLGAQVVTRVDASARYAAATTTPTTTATSTTRAVRTTTSAVEVSTLAEQVPTGSKVVVLAAGEQDGSSSGAQLQQGVLRSVRAVEGAAPNARLVLLAPVRASTSLHRALGAVAALKHLVYIDPMVCGWLMSAGDLTADGRSLTPQGRAHLAAGLRAVLAQLASSDSPTTTPTPDGSSVSASSVGEASASDASAVPSATSEPSSTTTPSPGPTTNSTSVASASASAAASADGSSAPASSAASRPTPAGLPQLPAGSTAYFFGDSWVHGESATNLKGFPFITASHFGWSPVVDGKSGSGYIHSTVASSPLFPARAAAVPASINPDVVIVEGGLNDRMSELSTLQTAAKLTWSRLANRFPDVPIVVVGPASPTLPVSPQLQQVDKILQQAATDDGLTYISPLQEHWFTSSNVGEYVADATLHPNDAGHAYYATRLETDLVTKMRG